jgi:integration host factor subunit alpha
MYYKGLSQSEEASMTLTKAHMSQKIADDCCFLKGKATEVLEKLLDIIKKGLVTGEDVMISGFGKWNVRSKPAGQYL